MQEIVNNFGEFIKNIGIFGPILSCFLILIESIVPILPLAAFITFNFFFFGSFIGFIISWLFTIFGCSLSYFIFDKKIKNWYTEKLLTKNNVKKVSKNFEKLTFSELVVLISIPFTPAFLINILAGITNVPFKKFLGAIAIGKIFLVLFWGYIGTSLIESINNPVIIIKIVVIVLVAYIVSKILNKKFKFDEKM